MYTNYSNKQGSSMTHLSTLAVNVFGEENKANETTQQNIQTPADQPDAKTPSSTEQGTGATTTQVATGQDDGSNLLTTSIPWVAAGIVAIVILIALLGIWRKVSRK